MALGAGAGEGMGADAEVVVDATGLGDGTRDGTRLDEPLFSTGVEGLGDQALVAGAVRRLPSPPSLLSGGGAAALRRGLGRRVSTRLLICTERFGSASISSRPRWYTSAIDITKVRLAGGMWGRTSVWRAPLTKSLNVFSTVFTNWWLPRAKAFSSGAHSVSERSTGDLMPKASASRALRCRTRHSELHFSWVASRLVGLELLAPQLVRTWRCPQEQVWLMTAVQGSVSGHLAGAWQGAVHGCLQIRLGLEQVCVQASHSPGWQVFSQRWYPHPRSLPHT